MPLLILAGCLIIIIFLIAFIEFYRDATDKNIPKIKFNTFKKFYDINPNRWKLSNNIKYENNYVACYMTRHADGMLSAGYYKFCFGLIDYYRYIHWIKHIKKQKTNLENMQLMADMIAAVKEDIAKCEQNANSEINQAKSILETLCK